MGRIDTQILQQIETEKDYWRNVLKRVVSTVKLLTKLGVAFRGHREGMDSQRKGNFLSCIEYLAEYDEFLKNHLMKYENCGSGKTNYLSHHIFDEFIKIMAQSVLDKITSKVKNAIYYSIIVDSTPDVSHVDQLSFILRYVTEYGAIQESFCGFIQIEHHDSAYLTDVVLNTLQNFGISVTNCRGQSYDNAANMAGKYTGLQARIKEHSETAYYVPCAAHSLNLVGNCAAESCLASVDFFSFVNNLFTFFSSSTSRWKIVIDHLSRPNSKHLKRVSDTRWSARADAVLALREDYQNIKEALKEFCESSNQQPASRVEAKGLLKKMDEYETVLLTVLWNKLLSRINSTSKSLQEIKCNLLTGSNLLKSLTEFVNNVRNNFESIENEATELLNVMEDDCRTFKDERSRDKKRKLQFDDSRSNEIRLAGRIAFIVNVHNTICDALSSELIRRRQIYDETLKDFQFFFHDQTDEEIEISINNLSQKYASDIQENTFKDEVLQWLRFTKEMNITSPTEMYKAIITSLRSTFPNVETILKIFLTIPVCNATAERSFSVLKRVKNYLRNSLLNDNLSCLAILFIENELVQEINYDEMIDNFSRAKVRRVAL